MTTTTNRAAVFELAEKLDQLWAWYNTLTSSANEEIDYIASLLENRGLLSVSEIANELSIIKSRLDDDVHELDKVRARICAYQDSYLMITGGAYYPPNN